MNILNRLGYAPLVLFGLVSLFGGILYSQRELLGGQEYIIIQADGEKYESEFSPVPREDGTLYFRDRHNRDIFIEGEYTVIYPPMDGKP